MPVISMRVPSASVTIFNELQGTLTMPIADSDPRVFFAAERTLLAWLRTASRSLRLGSSSRFGLFVRLLAMQTQGLDRCTLAMVCESWSGIRHRRGIVDSRRGRSASSFHCHCRIGFAALLFQDVCARVVSPRGSVGHRPCRLPCSLNCDAVWHGVPTCAASRRVDNGAEARSRACAGVPGAASIGPPGMPHGFCIQL